MTAGERIKELRELKGWTQEELAKKCGYKTKSTISKIETSGDDISMQKLWRVANALNVPPSYIMGWVEEDYSCDYAVEVYEQKLFIEKWRSLSNDNQQRVRKYLNKLLELEKMENMEE